MAKATNDLYQCDFPRCDTVEEVPHDTPPKLNWRHVTLDSEPQAKEIGKPPVNIGQPKAFYFCPVCARDTFGDEVVIDGDVITALKHAPAGSFIHRQTPAGGL